MALAAALVLLLLGLLPIANWIPGGHTMPGYATMLSEWLNGAMIVGGVGIIAAIVARRQPRFRPPGRWADVGLLWRTRGWKADVLVAAGGVAAYGFVARSVLSARPLLIDEIIQTFQARIFASGRLWNAAAAHPEFTASMHLLDWNGKVYGQFPAGGPAMLAIGTLLRAEWLVGPIAAAFGVLAFARLLRRIEPHDGAALAALLLYTFAPFTLFLSGSAMNHVTTTAWLLAASLALAISTSEFRARPLSALAAGFALGMAGTIRPMDAIAFAIPAAAWLVIRARRNASHVVALLCSGLGVAIPLAALLFVNAAQTGHALRFGYIEMWGKSHELGFHAAPWGDPHTPLRGLELVNLYLWRLQSYFLETPVPALLFAIAALALVRRLTAFDRWVLASGGLLLAVYFAYWHDGFYLGPRFMLPLAPWLALWTARLPAILRERRARAWIESGVVAAGVAALFIAAVVQVPIRARQYRGGMSSLRLDADAAAAAQGVSNAVVLVRESWGAQLLVRLWARGVSRTDAEHFYRTTDACHLETALTDAERTGDGATALQARLAQFGDDSAKLVSIRNAPDTTVRFRPGETLSPRCVRRLREDQAGFALYSPLLLAHGNVYLRDLHARDSLVLNPNDPRPLWLLTKATVVGAPLRFTRVSRDSMLAEWRLNP